VHHCKEVAQGRIIKMNIRRGLEPILVDGDVPCVPLFAWEDYFRQKMIVSISRDHATFWLAEAITQDGLSAPMTIIYCLQNCISPPFLMEQFSLSG
jgi:hypothetical protein